MAVRHKTNGVWKEDGTDDTIESEIRKAGGFSSETKIRVRKKRGRTNLSIKFGEGEEDQKRAHDFMGALRDSHLEAEEQKGKPLHIGKDGAPIYRILLFGLRWRSAGKGTSCYLATDGPIRVGCLGSAELRIPAREWAVGKDANDKWGVVLHDERENSPHIIADGLRTLREAKDAAEEAARRMPEIED